jgi:hypothetical protein
MNGKKLGELLLHGDVLTKRQLNKAIAMQQASDDRKLGEILVELGYITVDDITDVMMQQASKAQEVVEKGKRDFVLQQQILKTKSKPKPVTPKPGIKQEPVMEKQPIDMSQDAVMKTKFALDVKTIIAAATGIASLVGMWYMLQADIQEAKELPKIGNIYNQEYPSKPEGYNWPRSYEQYKENVEDLQDTVDELLDFVDEYEAKIEELEKKVTELRVQMANKRDK